MIQVSNKKCIRSLSYKTLRANKTRNLIAAAAIALTTLMFSSLFTVALTIVNSYQQETFRQVGGDMHGSFKDITLEQMAELKEDPLIVSSCARLILGIPSDVPFNKAHVEVSYMDSSCARGSFCEPESGSLPEEGTNQIACDTRILSLLGVEPEIGARINFSYNLGINTTAPVPVRVPLSCPAGGNMIRPPWPAMPSCPSPMPARCLRAMSGREKVISPAHGP